MKANQPLGDKSEEIAANHLLERGFIILHRNWRHSRYEIDIIATKDEVLHFIEVKSLSGNEIIYPEQHVTSKNFQSLKKAASTFLAQYKMQLHGQLTL